MKRAFFSLLVVALVLGGTALARDLKTISGDVYKNVSLRSRDATGIQIMHDDGVIFLDFKNLSDADQKDFGYNADTYADGWKQKFEAEKLRREQAELIARQAIARAQALAAEQASGAEQPANQTGVQVTVDTPGFTYGGYPITGYLYPGFYSGTTVAPQGPYRSNGYLPYNGNGATWGPLQIRRH